jgi:large subunit ribosomal protein L35
MPKLKTRKSAKKRFRLTASGKLVRKQAGYSHMQRKKSNRRKRSLSQKALVSSSDKQRVLRMLGKLK